MANFGNDLELALNAKLYNGGHFVYSSELAALLQLCEEHQSLHKAARMLQVSYRRALQMVRSAEEGFGQQILYKAIGGLGGGGSCLTEFGLKLTRGYAQMERDLTTFAAQRWQEIFPGTRARAIFPGPKQKDPL